MTISVDSLAYVDHLKFCSVRLFKASSDCIALGIIKVAILNHQVALLRPDLSYYLANCLIGLMLHIEEIVDLSFAAITAQEEKREEKENDGGDKKIEASIAEGFSTVANDIDF